MNVRCASLATVFVMLAAACARGDESPDALGTTGAGDATQACEPLEARALASRLGRAMRRVSLLAPDSVVARELRDAYSGIVTPELLAAWTDDPGSAPGRRVSSPWPHHIQVDSVQACVVYGTVMYATSADTTGDVAGERVSVRVAGAPLRIAGYEAQDTRAGTASGSGAAGGTGVGAGSASSPETDAAAAADVVRHYYAAIQARDFRRAYEQWSKGSAPQTFDRFRDGYADTRGVRVTLGTPGRIEPAAGSRYISIPVNVDATLTSGARQRFEGSYTLRRSVVDGATGAQREWRIYSASLRKVE